MMDTLKTITTEDVLLVQLVKVKEIKLKLRWVDPGWHCFVCKSHCFHFDSWQTKGLGTDFYCPFNLLV